MSELFWFDGGRLSGDRKLQFSCSAGTGAEEVRQSHSRQISLFYDLLVAVPVVFIFVQTKLRAEVLQLVPLLYTHTYMRTTDHFVTLLAFCSSSKRTFAFFTFLSQNIIFPSSTKHI